MTRLTPTVCDFCGATAATDEAFEAHLAEAQHWAAPAYPAYRARQNVDLAVEAATRAEQHVAGRLAEFEQITGRPMADPRLRALTTALHTHQRVADRGIPLPFMRCTCGWYGPMGASRTGHLVNVMLEQLTKEEA